MFYEIKLKVEKENSKGEMKEVIEHFITDVGLFAEAEAKGLEQYNGNCDVFSITRSNVVEIVNEKEEGKPFYKATLIDIFIDDNGNENRGSRQDHGIFKPLENLLRHLQIVPVGDPQIPVQHVRNKADVPDGKRIV